MSLVNHNNNNMVKGFWHVFLKHGLTKWAIIVAEFENELLIKYHIENLRDPISL